MSQSFHRSLSMESVMVVLEGLLDDNQYYSSLMMRNLSNLQKIDDSSLNASYILIVSQPEEKYQLLDEIIKDQSVVDWIHSVQKLQATMSKKSLTQLLELMEIRIEKSECFIGLQNSGEVVQDEFVEMNNHYLQRSQDLLACLYNEVIRSDDSKIFSMFVRCVSMIYKLVPQKINQTLYAEMISTSLNNDIQFYSYLIQNFSKDFITSSIRSKLLRGFISRMKKLESKSQLLKDERYGIIKGYEQVANFLLNNKSTQWPEEIQQVIICLKTLLNKNFPTNNLAGVVNKIVVALIGSDMKNIKKFEEVLALYKAVLLKVPNIYPFIKTDFLNEEIDFLAWFQSKQLRLQKAEQIGQFYLKNQYSLEFLLLMSILVVKGNPLGGKGYEIGNLMRCINLLDEAKYFMHKKDIVEYLVILYESIGQIDQFQDFMNRVEDSHILRFDGQ